MMPYRFALTLFLGALFPGLTATAHAGAWTQKQRGYYLKLAAYSFRATSDLDARGTEVPRPGRGTLSSLDLSAYVEYGLSEHLTLVASMPYKRLEDKRTIADFVAIERTWGAGDLETRLRWKLRDRPLVAAVAAGARIPLGYDVDAAAHAPLGSGELDGDIRLLLGRSLYPFPGYLSGEIGYRARGGPYGSEIFYALEAGVSKHKFLFKGYLSSLRTLATCGANAQAGLSGDQNILKVSPGLIYRLRQNAELSFEFIHIASGCNTAAGNTLSLGMALKR